MKQSTRPMQADSRVRGNSQEEANRALTDHYQNADRNWHHIYIARTIEGEEKWWGTRSRRNNTEDGTRSDKSKQKVTQLENM